MDLEFTPEEQKLLAKDARDLRRFGYWMQAILALIAASALIVLVQAFMWLRDGDWPSLSLRDALDALQLQPTPISWVGLQRIADIFWSLPLSGFLFFLAMAAIFWVTRGEHKDTPEALRQARMKQARAMRKD